MESPQRQKTKLVLAFVGDLRSHKKALDQWFSGCGLAMDSGNNFYNKK